VTLLRRYDPPVRHHLSLALIGACTQSGTFAIGFETLVDTTGENDVACVLTLSRGSRVATYEISVPQPPLTNAPAPTTRAPLGQCTDDGNSVTFTSASTATPLDGAPPIRTLRSLNCMQLYPTSDATQQALFDWFGVSSNQCPTSLMLTLTCGATTIYQDAPFGLCVVGL